MSRVRIPSPAPIPSFVLGATPSLRECLGTALTVSLGFAGHRMSAGADSELIPTRIPPGQPR